MNSEEAKTCTFVRLSQKNEYFCNRLKLASFLALIFLRRKYFYQIFQSNKRKYAPAWIMDYAQFIYLKQKRNIFDFLRFLRYKLKVRSAKEIIEFNIPGEFCVVVNKGYKIFNFRKNSVFKIFRDDVGLDVIRDEIENLQKAARCNASPKLLSWNIDERGYEEEYLRGFNDFTRNALDTGNFLKKFRASVAPILEAIMFCDNPQQVEAKTHYNCRLSKLLQVMNDGIYDEGQKEKIKHFIDDIHCRQNLQNFFEQKIYLLYSHGDFCPANFVNTADGPQIIDWEGAQTRSALFDFYSYFFYRPVHQVYTFDNLSEEIMAGLNILSEQIYGISPEISENLSTHARLYRHIYYVERICMLLARQKQDTKLDISAIVLRFVEAYHRFEKHSGSHHPF